MAKHVLYFSVFSTELTPWMAPRAHYDEDPVIRAIQGLGNLPDGWDYGRGISPDLETIKLAASLYRNLWKETGKHVEVIPASDGGIVLSFVVDSEKFIEVTVNSRGSFDYSVEAGFGAEYDILVSDEGVEYEEIRNIVHEQLAECASLERSRSRNTLYQEEDLPATAFKNWKEMFRYSPSSALLSRPKAFAST